MTRDEHVYAVQNLINRGAMSDDTRFTNRLVHHFLKVSRALLVKRKLDKYHHLNEENYQSICMPLIKTTFHDCECVPNLDCMILRSKYKLPKQVDARWDSVLKVYFFDGRPIGKTSVSTHTKSEYSRSSLSEDRFDKIFYFLYNGYLYITGTLNLAGILVNGLFEDPDDLTQYTLCADDGVETSDPCYDPETDSFPIDAELVYPMYEMTLNMLGIGNKHPEDNENNARATQIVRDQEEA